MLKKKQQEKTRSIIFTYSYINKNNQKLVIESLCIDPKEVEEWHWHITEDTFTYRYRNYFQIMFVLRCNSEKSKEICNTTPGYMYKGRIALFTLEFKEDGKTLLRENINRGDMGFQSNGVHIKLEDELQNVNLATKIEELLTKFCSQNAIQEN